MVVGLLGLVPGATAAATFKPCGTIVGYEHVVAKKVEVSGMSCEVAGKGIKSPKTPAQLGYRCKEQAHASVTFFTCVRKAGGTVKFREEQGK
jgi:hypothetical protein